jgi:predicted metal-dependent hydrolase
MFAGQDAAKSDSASESGLETPLPETPKPEPLKKIEADEEELKVYAPPPKNDEEIKAAAESVSAVIEIKEEAGKADKPQAKEAAGAAAEPKSEAALPKEEDEFKVFIPQTQSAPENEAGNNRNIKWLESSEDLAEFEEILKKAKID